MVRRILLSGLVIIVATFAVLSSSPFARSQGLITVTSLITATGPSTFTTTSSTAVVSYSPTEVTITSTSHTAPYLSLFWDEPLDIIGHGAQYGCEYYGLPFTEPANTVVVGNWTTNYPLTFFIMTGNAYNSWVSGNGCTVTDSIFQSYTSTQVSFSVVLPQTGTYYFLFENFSTDKEAKGSLFAQTVGTGSINQVLTTVAVTSENYLTLTGSSIVTSTSQTTLTENVLTYTLSSNPILFIAILVVILVGLALVVRSRRGRGRESETKVFGSDETDQVTVELPPSETEPVVIPVQPEGRTVAREGEASRIFCPQCGTKISADSTFCKACGHKIETDE